MLAFRSEEHVDRWCKLWRVPRGATMTLEQQFDLAVAWYDGMLDPEWRRRSPGDAEALFRQVGLRGEFWRLSE
jgi:hypothetical protein